MHILDVVKQHLFAECPDCERYVPAYKAVFETSDKATIFYKCGCGWKHLKTVKLEDWADPID